MQEPEVQQASPSGPSRDPAVVVIGHPNVVPHNQLIYAHLAEHGWRLRLVVPNRWIDEYSPGGYVPQPLDGLGGAFTRLRVVRPGAIQRHFYATRPSAWLARWRPDVVFLEHEPYAVPVLQWGIACQRSGIPWGVQGDDNLDRPLPWPARMIRRFTMSRASFFAARSPTASGILRAWGARAPTRVVPHTIPDWSPQPYRAGEPFTIGFAGRLVAQKGIDDLLAAVRLLQFRFRLLIVGDGPLRESVQRADADGRLGQGELDLRTGVTTAAMRDVYAEMDVLVLPSRTTLTWAEQFGKVLCEALLCGVPVVGAASGEIPWVVNTTGGGRVFPEGDAVALANALAELHADPAVRAELAARGAAGVERHFSARVAAQELDRLLRDGIARSTGSA